MHYVRGHTLLIDFEALVGNDNEVIIKEMAILKGNSLKVHTYLFKPPYPRSQLTLTASSRMKEVQDTKLQLDWSAGEHPYTYLDEIFGILNACGNLTNFLVNGEEKAQVLRKYSPKVKDVGIVMDFDEYKRFDHDCMFHEHKFRNCATHHVYQMNMYMTEENMFY